MAKEAILKVEKVEKGCEKLIEAEKEKLKLKLKEVKKKADEVVADERKKNFDIYDKVVDEFKLCVDKRSEEFNQKIEEQCGKLEEELKKNVSKAVDFVLMKILNSKKD